jgi:DNA helicase II / ATP-dependent DNA helicase PcrA
MSEKITYLDELNPAQRAAAIATEGPVMIIAGAGSGKTRVLTYRIAHLMHKGVDAFNILALTFTNKAAREMKARISTVVGEKETKNLWMGTFHSVFAKILRFEADKIGYPNNFTIYDTDDSKSVIKDILKSLNIDDKIYKPAMVLNRISSAKNNLIHAAAYKQNVNLVAEDRSSQKPLMGDIYEAYEKRCFKSGAMDFDDLLFNTNKLLRDFPDVLYKYQNKFRYIMVDEYQDTNFSQYVIVRQLAARFQNICVVGDDAQSIYSFRGASIQNILNFEKDYPDLQTFKLEQNYRSTKVIVNAANQIIANNKEQIKKLVWTDNSEGEK